MNLRIVIACLILGVLTEGLAYWQTLWVYDRPWLRIVSILVVFGFIFGWLSTAIADYPAWLRFASGAIVGVLYEGTNLKLLHVFDFPNQRLLFLRGPVALALGAGIPWGIAPLLAPVFRSL
jgi:hypothetical protein